MTCTVGSEHALAVKEVIDMDKQPVLKVVIREFPESNGRRNWTAMFVREVSWDGLVGSCGGITIARGEYWNRVAYEAERAKCLLGLRDTEPFVLDYSDDIKTPAEWLGEGRWDEKRGKRANREKSDGV